MDWRKEVYEELKGLHYRKKLLRRLEKKLSTLNEGYVADVVRDYRNDPKGIPIVIRGHNANKIAELRHIYSEQIETLIDEIKVAENLISAVTDDRDRLVLQMRYMDGMRIGEIALEMECSDRTITTILSRYK